MKQKVLTQGYSPKGLKLGVSCDADWESRVDRILNSLPEFEMRDYGSSLSEIFVILMCRDPDFNFKRRIRLSKKNNILYMDIMLGLPTMKAANISTRKRIVAESLFKEIPEVISKYQLSDFDTPKFIVDLQAWIAATGWLTGRDTVKININVSNSQLCVFRNDVLNPYNYWEPQHVKQGFTWRDGSVSFRTLVDQGVHSIQVDIFEEEQEFELSSDVIRAIEVPFETFEGIDTEVASTADSEVISIPSGKYNLRCEFLGNINEQTPRIRLVFEKTNRIRFAILRADERLSLPENLVTCAEPVTP